MSGIHFVGGEKGGVGKSVMARVLAQYMIERQLAFTAFDSDRSHGALLRYYSEYSQAIDASQYESLDTVVEAIAEQPERRVLVDLAAQTYSQLWQWFHESGVTELADELNVSLYYWHVMDAGSDSLRLLEQLLAEKDERLKVIVVRNAIRGERFSLLAQSGLQERGEAVGARFVDVPRLADLTMQKIDANGASFWAALHNRQGGVLGLLERQRLKVWLQRIYAELDMLEI